MNIIPTLLRRFFAQATDPAAARLYAACVAQSRLPDFYQAGGVPDTVEGRFDLLLLHIILVMQRLRDAPAATQSLHDLMMADIDRNLREIGVSDMRIGKRMRAMSAAFYGRSIAYETAINQPVPALAEAFQRNIYALPDGTPTQQNAIHLAHYAHNVITNLAEQNSADIKIGQVTFPKPAFTTL